MDIPIWAKGLDNETYDCVLRIMKSVPGFYSYVKFNPKSNDIHQLAKDYGDSLSQGNLLNAQIIANLDLLCEIVSKRSFLYPDSIRTWNPQPSWAKEMSHDDLIFMDHLFSKMPFMRQYVKANYEEVNLSRIICDYQLKSNIPFGEDTLEGLILFAIKERYNEIHTKKSSDAFYIVDNSKIINDSEAIATFLRKSEEDFYKSNLEEDDCSDFLFQYLEHFNPYIGFEIIDRLLKFGKVESALPFLKLASTFIFSTANVYWNNKEALYGCAIVSYSIIELLGVERLNSMENEDPELCKSIFRTTFLLLSRVINWEDYENRQIPSYRDKLLPINVQHKVRALFLRSSLIEKYASKLKVELDEDEYLLLIIADEMSTHLWTYANSIVGDDSKYKQKANSLFAGLHNRLYSTTEEAMRDGLAIIDSLSRQFYIEYVEGKYFLSYRSIKDLLKADHLNMDTQQLFGSDFKEIFKNNDVNKDIGSYKNDSQEIKNYLEEKGIKCFYHFTEISRIESIIKYGGIFSYQHCLENNIVIPVTKDMALTRDIDARKGLADYARLSFCKRLPKINVRKEAHKDLVLLKISTEVALLENTEFSNMEATRDEMSYGPSFSDLKKVNIAATQKEYCLQGDKDYWEYQAEILVREKIPLRYILNIGNPEII